jgi:tetratricopeptide (TPR) repeat protein
MFSEAIASNAQDPRFYNDRGVAHKRAGNLDAALLDYAKAMELKPNYTHALNNRGLLYLEQGLYDKAIADFTEALRHGELQSKIYTNMGLAKARKGDHSGAIKDYDKAFTYQPMDHRSFLFMAESLEKTGDLEKALRTYQLALGLVNDRQAVSVIEAQINRLETQTNSFKTSLPGAFEKTSKPRQLFGDDKSRHELGVEKPKPQLRDIAKAQPRPEIAVPNRPRSIETPKIIIESLESLEESTRSKALTKYSLAAREIYGQGREFLSKSDTTKALIRFEDARQLEKRSKNPFTMAWSDVEIARVYTKLGDHVRAESYLNSALKLFDATKSDDQVVLALVELATTNRQMGKKDRASSFFTQARDKAASLGYDSLVKAISNTEAGVPPSSQKKVAASEAPQKRDAVHSRPTAPSSPSVPAAKATGLQASAGSPSQIVGEKKRPEDLKVILKQYEGKKPSAVETQVGPKQQPGSTSALTSGKPSVFRDGPPDPSNQKLTSRSASGVGAPGGDRPAGNQPQVVRASVVPAEKAETSTPKEPTLKEDLLLLKELKKKNDETQMILVLERLGKRYFEMGDFQRSVHGFSAAVSLREKLSLNGDLRPLLELRSTARENLGAHAEALEDLIRSAYLMQTTGIKPDNRMRERFRTLTKSLGLDADKIFEAFILLWESRKKADIQGEARALLMVADAYDKAQRFPEALKYYERSSALLLANRAEVFGKMGKEKLAEEHYSQALEALRNLDYSDYIHIMKRSKIAGAQPQQ